MTYPQEILQGETYTQSMFEGYFFGADVLLGVVGEGNLPDGKNDGSVVELSLDVARNGRSWEESVAGVYYVSSYLYIWALGLTNSCVTRSNQTILAVLPMYVDISTDVLEQCIDAPLDL